MECTLSNQKLNEIEFEVLQEINFKEDKNYISFVKGYYTSFNNWINKGLIWGFSVEKELSSQEIEYFDYEIEINVKERKLIAGPVFIEIDPGFSLDENLNSLYNELEQAIYNLMEN